MTTRTKIPCEHGPGYVVLEVTASGAVYLDWSVDDEDALGQPVWPLAVPQALVRALGTNVAQLIQALSEAGRGFQVEAPRDMEQQRIRAQVADATGWKDPS